jgi:hypothetical protein
MTVTNTNAAELNDTQLDQVVGAGGLMIERRGNAVGSDVVVPDDISGTKNTSATGSSSDVVLHERSGK